jgi:F0F1-type ATP synthase assembly protein I
MPEDPATPDGSASKRKDDDAGFLQESLEQFQRNVTRAGPAAAASYTLIGAILLLGGIGYAIDSWRGRSHWFLLLGLFVGLVVGFVDLARSVWKR